MSIHKDITKVFSSNLVVLLSGIVNGFILPIILSIDDYANLRTYFLYIHYIGLLHFGLVDGIFINYGGKYYKNINVAELNFFHLFFIVFQLIITSIILFFAIFKNDTILILLAVSILPINLQNLLTFIYQSFWEFQKYSIARAATPLVILISNLVIVFLFKSTNYVHYIIASILGYTILSIFLDINFIKKNHRFNDSPNYKVLLKLFKSGILILLGNLSFVFLFAVGRRIVKIFLENKEFAIYSFTATLMTLITIFVNSITNVFFTHLARKKMIQIQLIYIKEHYL